MDCWRGVRTVAEVVMYVERLLMEWELHMKGLEVAERRVTEDRARWLCEVIFLVIWVF